MTGTAWTRARITRGLLLVVSGFLPGAVLADSGLFARPSLTVAEIHDDNLFFSAQPVADRFLRVTPALEAGYRSVPMTVTGRLAFDAERYAQHAELDDNRARENAALDLRYESSHLLTVLGDASYIRTQAPGELTPETGLQFGRARAEQLSVGPSLIYRFDRLAVGTASYRFVHDEVAGGSGSDTHTVALGLDREVTRRNTASVRYRFEQFRFDVGDTVNAHVLLGGGTHEFTPRTVVTVLAGPRFSEGETSLEASASLFHKLERGEFDLGYTRSQNTVLGLSGPVMTDAISATYVRSFGSSLEVRAAPSYLSNKHDDRHADVFIMDLEAGYRLTRYLTLLGSYQFSSQRGSLDAPTSGEITRNLILLGLTIAAPERTSSGLRPSVLPSPRSTQTPARKPTDLGPGAEK